MIITWNKINRVCWWSTGRVPVARSRCKSSTDRAGGTTRGAKWIFHTWLSRDPPSGIIDVRLLYLLRVLYLWWNRALWVTPGYARWIVLESWEAVWWEIFLWTNKMELLSAKTWHKKPETRKSTEMPQRDIQPISSVALPSWQWTVLWVSWVVDTMIVHAYYFGVWVTTVSLVYFN